MSIGILGPLTVTDRSGRPVALGPRDRVVLTVLAGWPGETVRPDRLASALWPDDPPASWNKVVQGCVARIRKVLGAGAIMTTPVGYRLAVPPDEVDAHRFERLCGRGRELLTLGEPDRAAYVLGEALDLWRGPPLADLERWPAARPVAERLQHLRSDAEETRLDAGLRTGRSRELLATAQAQVADEPFRERRWALLALAQYQAGAQAEALATLRRTRRMLADDLGLEPGPELADLERAILRHDPGLLPATAVATDGTCPYQGLVPYGVDDAETFFGRETDVATCLRRLETDGVLVIVGPSGCGKSSVLRAGIVAALRRDGKRVTLADSADLPDAGDVLAIDQCEEVVARSPDRARFFADLLAHARKRRLVLALRADQLGVFSESPDLARLIEQRMYLLGAMGEADLRAAIEGPSRQRGLLLEAGLVDLLVREVHGTPGALPFLSHALRQTWRRREGRTLTVAGYLASGGIRDALTRTADEIFAGLPPDTRDRARQLFLRLVSVSEDGVVLPRRVPRDELASLQADRTVMDEAVDAFGAARLLSFDRDPHTGVPTVQIAHQALLTGWTQLREWLEQSREDLLVERRLRAAARDWCESGREDSFLATGSRLEQFTTWRERSGLAITPDERDFLRAAAALRHRAARRPRILAAVLAGAVLVTSALAVVALTQQRRAEREARLAAAGELAAAAVANLGVDPERSILLALRALDLGGSVHPEAREALHRAVVASRVVLRVPDIGGTLDWSSSLFVTEGEEESGRIDLRSADDGRVVRSFHGHDTDVNAVAFSPGTNGTSLLATTGDDGTARVWDPATGAALHVVRGPGTQVYQPSFSADGRLLAAVWVGDTGVARLTDLATGQSRDLVTGAVMAADLSPDGTRLAVALEDPLSTVVVDAATGRHLFTTAGHDLSILSVSFSPDGRMFATTGVDRPTRIWNARDGTLLATLYGHTGPVNVAAWSPDSARLATGSTDGAVKIWQVDDGRELLTLSAYDMRNGVQSAVFSADGTRLMAGDEAHRTVRIWDVGPAGDAEVANLPGDWRWIGAPVFTVDGGGIVVGNAAGAAALFDVSAGHAVRSIGPAASVAAAGRPSPAALLFPLAGPDGALQVWDAVSGAQVLAVSDLSGRVALSADGTLVAVSDGDGVTRVLDLAGTVLGEVREEPGFRVTDVRFGGRHLLATGRLPTDRPNLSAQRVTIWDWARGTVVQTLPSQADVAAFDRDATRAVTVASEPAIWDVRTGRRIAALAGFAVRVLDAAFSPDGSVIATAGFDATVRLWDARTGVELLALRGHRAAVTRVAFSPDGTRLASTSSDDTTRVWELDPDRLAALARRELSRGFTDEECRQYLGRAGCP